MKIFEKLSQEALGATDVWIHGCKELLPWEGPPHGAGHQLNSWPIQAKRPIAGGLALSCAQDWDDVLLGQGQTGKGLRRLLQGPPRATSASNRLHTWSVPQDRGQIDASISEPAKNDATPQIFPEHPLHPKRVQQQLQFRKWPCEHMVTVWWVLRLSWATLPAPVLNLSHLGWLSSFSPQALPFQF